MERCQNLKGGGHDFSSTGRRGGARRKGPGTLLPPFSLPILAEGQGYKPGWGTGSDHPLGLRVLSADDNSVKGIFFTYYTMIWHQRIQPI